MDHPRGALVGHAVAGASGEGMGTTPREEAMVEDTGVVDMEEEGIMETEALLVMIGKL